MTGYEEFLGRHGLSYGDRVQIVTRDGRKLRGIVLPRYSSLEKPILTLKLDNGYNVGVRFDNILSVERIESEGLRLEEAGAPMELATKSETGEGELPRVLILGTGGTIASKIDYETGAVKPALTTEDLIDAVPELTNIIVPEARVLFNIFSENMTPKLWEAVAEEVYKALTSGYQGVIIAHGTDTMAYTSAALSFALRELPCPIALVGAQRSSDRPSSDAAFNLVAASLVEAKAPFGEVVVVMHGEPGDTYALAHRGTRVRKMHTSRRDAFQSINDLPLAKIYPEEGKVAIVNERYIPRSQGEPVLLNGFEERVALLKVYPGMGPEVIDFLVDKGYRGLVLEATGLGHTPERLIPSIARASEEGVPVVIASQCLFGSTNLNVYSTGRRLLAAGAIPAGDMLPETAFVKLSWVLRRTSDPKEVAKLMATNMVGELSPRRPVAYYPRWQHD